MAQRRATRATKRAAAIAAMLCATGAPIVAHAQDVPEGVYEAGEGRARPGAPSVFGLPDEGWTRPSSRLGMFMLDLGIELGGLYNSNIIPNAPDKESDIAARVAPFAKLRSQGRGYDLSAYANGTLQRYSDVSGENYEALIGGLKFSRAFTRAVAIDAVLEGGTDVEDRFAQFGQSASLTPVRYDRVYGRIGTTITPGRVIIAPSFEINRLAYHNNKLRSAPDTVLIQDIRSMTRINPSIVVGYALTPTTVFYGGAEYNERRYDKDRLVTDINGAIIANTMDSKGYVLFGGMQFQPSPLTRLEVRAGYQSQHYSGGLTDPNGLYLSASFDWQPLRTLFVQASLKRDISESGALLAGGSVRTVAKAMLQYQARRDVRLLLTAEHRESTVKELDTRSGRSRLIGEAQYLAPSHFELFVRGEWGCNCRSDRALESQFGHVVVRTGIRIHR